MEIFRHKNGKRPKATKTETFIGHETSFEGILDTSNTVHIEGIFRGQLKSSKGVIVNKVGKLEADVMAEYVIIHGNVTGNVTARKLLEIGPSGKITGNVEAGSVTIASGGLLDGFCKMIGSERNGSEPQDSPSFTTQEKVSEATVEKVVGDENITS